MRSVKSGEYRVYTCPPAAPTAAARPPTVSVVVRPQHHPHVLDQHLQGQGPHHQAGGTKHVLLVSQGWRRAHVHGSSHVRLVPNTPQQLVRCVRRRTTPASCELSDPARPRSCRPAARELLVR